MNSKEWRDKLHRGSDGSDAWDMLKDLQAAEKEIKRLKKEVKNLMDERAEMAEEMAGE